MSHANLQENLTDSLTAVLPYIEDSKRLARVIKAAKKVQINDAVKLFVFILLLTEEMPEIKYLKPHNKKLENLFLFCLVQAEKKQATVKNKNAP